MIINNEKIQYFLRELKNINQSKICPYCGGRSFDVVDRKYFVTSLLRCKTCSLNFRHPMDDQGFLNKYYQSTYSVDVAMITKLPSDEQLKELKEAKFFSIDNYVKFIKAFYENSNAKIIDYGCSWGYSVYQMKQFGYDVQGFEISKPRAEFGMSKLGVDIKTNTDDVRTENDVIFSAHVIEHLPYINNFLTYAKSKLKKDGIFIALCPNGTADYRKREPHIYHINWGFLHPNSLDIEFAAYAFRNNPYLLLTGDWAYDMEFISKWDRQSQIIGRRDGKELLIIARPNIQI